MNKAVFRFPMSAEAAMEQAVEQGEQGEQKNGKEARALLCAVDEASLRQGAEARIYECEWEGKRAVLKERFSKQYRHSVLDARLNRQRMRSEVKGIAKAKQLGVLTPEVYVANEAKGQVVMERVDGPTAKEWIEERRKQGGDAFETDTRTFGRALGAGVAKMHLGNLAHGDLTTSNVLLAGGDPEKPVFIDFGLAGQGKVSSEEKGVDLYVLERAIESTHRDSQGIFEGVCEGYRDFNEKQAEAVLKKLDEIRLRGRKRDMTG